MELTESQAQGPGGHADDLDADDLDADDLDGNISLRVCDTLCVCRSSNLLR